MFRTPISLSPSYKLLFAAFALFCFTEQALAQSSSRGDVLPTVEPLQAQPTYPQVAPMQGSTTRGSTTRGPIVAPMGTPINGPIVEGQIVNGPIVGGPIMEGSPYGSVMQGSSTRGPIVTAPPVKETFESRFWNYLVRSKYRNWAPVPGKSDDAYEGQSPHGAYLKMFLNRKAAGNATDLPDGAIVIKENYSPARALAAITVMYKTAGYNAKAGDWYWVKYNPDGTVASKSTEKGSVRLAGRVNGCIDCHSGAEGDDFVFFND